jgi:lipid-A-disaccharide synthase
VTRPPKILLSAGEASGDRLGAGLARAILRRRPDAELLGMGGDEMAAAGVRLVQHASEVAVMGLFEVLTHLPVLRGALARLERCLSEERPDLVVPIDFPDFNLRLAERAHRVRGPVVYFVSPQIWAWRRRRVLRIKRLVGRMLVLFPFETEFYENEGVPVTFVGHPAADRATAVHDGDALLRRAGLDPARDVVALVPGSREIEVARILPTLLRSAGIVRARRSDVQFLVPLAGTLSRPVVEARIRSSGLPDTVVHGADFPEVLGACQAGAVTSGTASLEAALVGLPMVVVYRMRWPSYLLARTLVRVDHAALPNLVAGRRIVPELIQHELRPETVADHLIGYLESPDRAAAVRKELADVRRRLGEPGAFDRAAEAVLAEIGPTGDESAAPS